MSKDLPQPQQSEEVDLGKLFKLIGNAFDRFFKFIASIFIGLYRVLIKLLIHFYKRKIWYAIIITLGFIAGFIIDSKSEKLYGANMFIQTNFNSARQVYENIHNLHELAVKDKDTVKLAEILEISVAEAASLKGFHIKPDLDENDMAEMYSQFYMKLDSISRLEMNYKEYKESLTKQNHNTHQIGVASTNKNIYKKIEQAFARKISENTYLKDLLKVNQENFENEEMALDRQIKETDTLVKAYLKIRVSESKKEAIQGAGTNLYMGNAQEGSLIVDESKMVDKILDLERQKRRVNTEKTEKQGIINVVSTFPETGYDIKEWTDKKKFVLPLGLFIIALIIFSGLSLGKYLEAESKK